MAPDWSRRIFRAHPGPFLLSILGAVLFSAAAVAVPLVVGHITDHLLVPAFDGGVSGTAVLGALAVLIGIGVLRGLSIIIRRYYAAMVEARMQVTLRSSVSEKYLDVPMSYYNDNPTGELLAHADADVVGTTNSIKPLPFSIGVVVLIVFALISLWLVDWTFAVVALVLFPALALLNRRYTNRVHRPVTLGQERLGSVSTIAHESFDGVLVVKTLGLVDSETERFAVEADALRQADLEAGRIRAGFDPVLDALPAPRARCSCSWSAVGGSPRARSRPGTWCRARCCSRSSRSPCACSASSSRRCRERSCRSTASTRSPRHRMRPARSVGRRSACPRARSGSSCAT